LNAYSQSLRTWFNIFCKSIMVRSSRCRTKELNPVLINFS
jgi:hypothetical protein